jgi:ABC-2 type transport system ATP-binding protein
LGPNGAGKTTTIRLLLDLLRPTEGRVEVLGRAPRDHRIRREIGYLPGELDLYPNLKGRELVIYLDNLRGGGGLSHAEELAERLDLDLTRPVDQLSKGNKQKLGLVQAFMHRPALLILDEPTSGLDPLMQRQFFLLVAQAQAAGATVFLSSHVLAEVERIAQRVGIIREGRLVELAAIEDLKARAVRRFQVRFAARIDPSEFAGVPGLGDIEVDDDILNCTVTGPVDGLVKAAAQFGVLDIISHGADLEALFLSYYRASDLGTRDAS